MNLTILGCPEGRFGLNVGCQKHSSKIMAQVMQNVSKMLPKFLTGGSFGSTLGLRGACSGGLGHSLHVVLAAAGGIFGDLFGKVCL